MPPEPYNIGLQLQLPLPARAEKTSFFRKSF